jgi:hypothetical protein
MRSKRNPLHPGEHLRDGQTSLPVSKDTATCIEEQTDDR